MKVLFRVVNECYPKLAVRFEFHPRNAAAIICSPHKRNTSFLIVITVNKLKFFLDLGNPDRVPFTAVTGHSTLKKERKVRVLNTNQYIA